VIIKFSARAWVLGAATALVILPTTPSELRAESPSTTPQAQTDSGEPRKLIERPATRSAISTSRPLGSFLPSLPSIFGGGKDSETKRASASPPSSRMPRDPNDGRSEVQRHLEELYRQNGRQAPDLEIGEFSRAAANAAAMQKSEEGAPIRQVSSNPFKRFLRKVSPFHRAKKNAVDETPEHVEPMTREMRRQQLRIERGEVSAPRTVRAPRDTSPVAIPMTKAPAAVDEEEDSLTRPLPSLDSQTDAGQTEASPDQQNQEAVKVPEFLPEKSLNGGALEEEASKESGAGANSLPEFKPAVELSESAPSLPDPADDEAGQSVSGSEDDDAATPSPLAKDDLLADPFPELSEDEADGQADDGQAKNSPADDSEEPAALRQPEAAAKAETAKQTPFSDQSDSGKPEGEVRQTSADSAPIPSLPDLPQPESLSEPADAEPAGAEPAESPVPDTADAADTADTADDLPVIKPAQMPADDHEPKHEPKMAKIAERAELNGLKGFCPVALRDSRELVDARPEFQSTYNGTKYNLASEEAKAKFEADPEFYVPAADGQDVVLASQGQSEVSGSLEHAVWFRNRLYLFASSASLKEFETSPKKYVDEGSDQESSARGVE